MHPMTIHPTVAQQMVHGLATVLVDWSTAYLSLQAVYGEKENNVKE